jgi:hypothetical protein
MKKTWNIANTKAVKYNEFSHWIDYLSFSVLDSDIIYKNFINWLEVKMDDDNASEVMVTIVDEVFTIKKNKTPNGTWYLFSCTYNSQPSSVFHFTEFSAKNKALFNTDWIMHFYGAFFRMKDLEWFSEDFLAFIDDHFLDFPISRIDYRYDFIDTEKIHPFPLKKDVFPTMRKDKKYRTWYKWDQLESWALGRKENKTIYIRMYDKLVHLNHDFRKIYLYWDLNDKKSYQRLEYEFWNKYCLWYRWKDIDSLITKIHATSWILPSEYKWLLYKPRSKLDLNDEIHRTRYVKIFKSMAQTLENSGIDPISIINL